MIFNRAALSRLDGGAHHPSGDTAGSDLRRCVASNVLARFGSAALQ